MKLFFLTFVLLVHFALYGEKIAWYKPENELPIIELSDEKFSKVRYLSRQQFHGFKENDKALAKLKAGKVVNVKSFYGRKRNNSKMPDSTSFYILKPPTDYAQILRDSSSEIYFLIDETLRYFQVVFLDTNNINEMKFVSGQIKKPYYKSFKSFESDLNIRFSDYLVKIFKDYEIMGWGDIPKPDQKSAAILWQQLQIMPFTGPKKIYERREEKDTTENILFVISKYNLIEPYFRLESYNLPVKYSTRYLWNFNDQYKNSDKRGSAFAFLTRYYSSSKIEVVNKFHSDLSKQYGKLLVFDSMFSYSQMKAMAPDVLKSLGFFDDTTTLIVRINGKDTATKGVGFELSEFSKKYTLVDHWAKCEYLCPFLFVKYDNALTVSQYEIIVDVKRNTTKIRFIGTFERAATIRELIEIK